MKLKEALTRAAKMVCQDKAQQVLRHVLLVPQAGDVPGKIVAGDGQVWTHLTLDDGCEVIDGALPVADLSKLLTDAKEVLRIEWAQGGGSATIVLRTKVDTAGKAELRVLPSSQYTAPTIPKGLDFVPDFAAHELPAVTHAVGGDDPREPHLGYVHASKDGLCASDGFRVALLQYHAAWQGLLSPRLFLGWPKRAAIALSVQRHEVFVRIGDDEIRQTTYAKGPYPDAWTRARALEPHTGPRLLLPTKALAGAVKQASTMGPVNSVWLRLREGRLKIESVALDESKSYQAEILGEGGQKDMDTVIDGRMLYQALASIKTPKVLVGYRRRFDPVRVESGRFIECIWPMEGPGPQTVGA